jgi:lipoprotein-releasing system ATP-binding protein
MCDEPTGNLDKVNSLLVFDIFKKLTQQFNQTLLVVTHDQDFAAKTNRIIEMDDGRIIKQ